METSIIGFIAFIIAYVAGRIISERALNLLSEDEQKKLLQGFSKYKIFSLVGIILIVVIHYGLRFFVPESSAASMPAIVTALVLYLLANTVISYKKLKNLEMPDEYINRFLFSTLIQYVGLFLFFGLLLNKN